MTEVLHAPYVLEYTYTRNTGPIIGRFLEGLRYQELYGVKTADGRVLCPAAEYDESGEATTGEFVRSRRQAREVVDLGDRTACGSSVAKAVCVRVNSNRRRRQRDGACDRRGECKRCVTACACVCKAEKGNGTIKDIECFEPISPVLLWPRHMQFEVYPGDHKTAFLRALEQGKFIGGKCPDTGKVYVPPIGASPTSGKPTTEYVDVADTGVLTSFTVIAFPLKVRR
ncbi:MAG: zinc ribbon domain-containing protein [Polyangiales bacterium]